jgi:hypothetical protein
MASMSQDDQRTEIVRLEAQIDELEATVESCRKFILAGRIAIASGGVILIAILIGGIQLPRPLTTSFDTLVTFGN